MYDNCQKIRFKPSNIINGEKEIHRILTNDPELILIYPPQRELILTRFWNENINDYNQLLNDFSPLINYDKVLIELRDNNSKPANYNNNPIKVVSTHAYYDNGLSAIKSDLQNISNLCHEFAHAYDAKQSKTKDENLTTILERIKPPLTKMFNLSLITFDTSPIQKIYELRDDEIFARALNQHYLRTRGDNVFANPIKPQISDYVIDYIYHKRP